LSKLTGAPLVFDFQGSLTSEMIDHNFLKPTSPFFKPLHWLERRIDHMAHAVLTSSRHAARLLRDTYGVPEGRIHPTPDCVNPDAFDPARFDSAHRLTLKRALGIPADRQLLVYVGLLTEYQGVGHLLRALAQLRARRPDVHLLLMGFGELHRYVSLARELGIRDAVTFTGKMPYERLPAHLALGDIAVAPKLSATEGNGKVLNYMSMALPTVAFPTPVSREYLGQHGLYAAARTPAALAAALDRALSMSPAARADLGHALRNRILANYTWANIGRQIEAVYRAVLDGHPQPAQAVKQAATWGKTPT
ncbi:MAG: glycosyltransferase family 1 protein, partial [Caldilineae bacterium]